MLKPRLAAERVLNVYETLERPLVSVLARMERRGISIDREVLSRLSGEFAQEAAGLEAEIKKIAGEAINPGSPKQLGDVLFGKLGLPGGTKTRTGQWSTGARALEDLAEQGHVLPQKILDWRQVSKLKSTYTDALPGFVNPSTHRVHTSYALAATTTGRLSSSDPNLQNIPVRTEDGRKIRRAFIAAPGFKLVSADYSQIELRLLAEIAGIEPLQKAFREGLDIHAMTASEMFGVPVKDMPGEIRRRAKAINFGIVYGISAFGLANQLGIAREEAGAYIRKYFERFPGIRDFIDEAKKAAKKDGYVLTIFGRKCHYPEINASNASVRSFNERAAVNARLQGSAADIIRRAMVRMEGALAAKKLSAQMLLQVHDELVFEVPEAEVEKTLPVIKKVMEDAPLPAVSLSVPLAGRGARGRQLGRGALGQISPRSTPLLSPARPRESGDPADLSPSRHAASGFALAREKKGELQVLFDRRIADRHVNQSTILKPGDELVVVDRIDGDAAVAPPQHAIVLGAKGGGGVPVRVHDPFERRRLVDVLVVGGNALEHDHDHVSINGSVVAVDDRLVVIHHFGMSGLERAQRHHVKVGLEAFEFRGFYVGPVVSSMGRVVGGDLT